MCFIIFVTGILVNIVVASFLTYLDKENSTEAIYMRMHACIYIRLHIQNQTQIHRFIETYTYVD